MPKRRRIRQPPPPPTQSWFVHHLPKLLAGLLATGAVGGTSLSVATGNHADERSAKLETRVDGVERDAGVLARKVERINTRTIRIETQQELMMDALRVPVNKRPAREYGPSEP